MKQRNHAFDLLCGICIIRMVLLHITQFCGHAQDGWVEELMAWTYFFMSFFFFKAGYFNKGVAGTDSRSYCIDRTKRLLVPYLTAGWCGLVIFAAFQPFLIHRYHNPVDWSGWAHIWKTSSFYGNLPVWFLFSFYSMYITVHFLERGLSYTGRWMPWLLAVVVAPMPLLSYWAYQHGNPVWMSLSNLPMGIFFFYLGRWWHRAMDRMGRRWTLIVSSVMVVGFVVGNVLWHGEYAMASNRFEGDFLPTMLNTVLALCGLAGILLTLRTPYIPGLCYIGEHSMVYFISHYPILFYYKFAHLCYGRSIFGRYDDIWVLVPAIFMLCTWFVPYVERVPWLSGRWKQKEEVKYNTPNIT